MLVAEKYTVDIDGQDLTEVFLSCLIKQNQTFSRRRFKIGATILLSVKGFVMHMPALAIIYGRAPSGASDSDNLVY